MGIQIDPINNPHTLFNQKEIQITTISLTDIGDISMSRYTEMLGAFWVPIYGKVGNMNWGLKLVRELKKK